MRLRQCWRTWKIRMLAGLARRAVRKTDPAALMRRGHRRAIRAFRRAARKMPAYRRLLQAHNVDPARVDTIEAFAHLPTTDKKTIFTASPIEDLWTHRPEDLSTVYTSSGYSKTFSFGLETTGQVQRGAENLDLMLEMYLSASRQRTLLVNALPMGVRVAAQLPVVFDASTRADSVIAVIGKLHAPFRHVVLVGEHPFLKRILEDGAAAGLDWPACHVSLITGAETMPESFRTYAGGILGHEPDDPGTGRVFVSTGISEVGLTIGHETDACRRIRRQAARDDALRRAVFGDGPYLPTFVQYLPAAYWIETPADETGRGRLTVTTCQPGRIIPLIRYDTGDWAEAVEHGEICRRLASVGREDLTPDWTWPFLILWGRGRHLDVAGQAVYPEQVKEALYRDAELAAATTACFHMDAEGDGLGLRWQLAPNTQPADALQQHFENHFSHALGMPVTCRLIPYLDYTPALDLPYQRKFRYLD